MKPKKRPPTTLTAQSLPALAELHFHLGSSQSPLSLWEVAHNQGIKLAHKDPKKFIEFFQTSNKQISWEYYHELFKTTELIQSSPQSIEKATYDTLVGAYIAQNITLLEPLFCPMFRNRRGERDLDSIILGAVRGMERALVQTPLLRAGLIMALDRRLSFEENSIIVEKAIKYRRRGVVGIDIAGPLGKRAFDYRDYAHLFALAQESGLKTSVHTGEDGSVDEMEYVLRHLPLDRINHGIKCVYKSSVMQKVLDKNLTLCICPTSNLKLGIVEDMSEMRKIVNTLIKQNVKFCINTDSPCILNTSVRQEFQLLFDHEVLDYADALKCVKNAFTASFVDRRRSTNIYI